MEAFIRQLTAKHQQQSTRLLMILREIQQRFFHIPEAAVEQLATELNIARTQIISVIEFYSFLSATPRGQYTIYLSDSITDRMLGSQALTNLLCNQLQTEVNSTRADGRVSIHLTSCTGLCEQGPAILVNGYAIGSLTRQRVIEISQLIEQQTPLENWPNDLFNIDNSIKKSDQILSTSLPQGMAIQATLKRGAAETLQTIEASGLKGRGGAGFLTAKKWGFCRQNSANDNDQATESPQRYVVCNADEGEPGTFKDRVLLNQHANELIEGMTVCALIIGADQGFIYLRGEYLFLYNQLQAVIEQRRNNGLLGRNLFNRNFNFDIEIRLGLGAYICGEESALIESLEGKRGIPRNRPPFPVTSGYLNKPTVVNNVETFINAAHIAYHGSLWLSDYGTDNSKGTKILSISGDCRQPGIYEYAFGTPIKQILTDCGAEDVFGIQIGGPSGSFIHPDEFDRVLAFEDLATGGSFIIFNRSRNLFDIVQNFTHFFAHESCGFCTPCRVGTSLLKKQYDKIQQGHGGAGDLAELKEIAELIKSASHCGLGQTAANPILTTLARYPKLYQQQLQNIDFEPGFDLDGSLAAARKLSGRDDKQAHLTQWSISNELYQD